MLTKTVGYYVGLFYKPEKWPSTKDSHLKEIHFFFASF